MSRVLVPIDFQLRRGESFHLMGSDLLRLHELSEHLRKQLSDDNHSDHLANEIRDILHLAEPDAIAARCPECGFREIL